MGDRNVERGMLGCFTPPVILLIIGGWFVYTHFIRHNDGGTTKSGYSIPECNKATDWLKGIATQETVAMNSIPKAGADPNIQATAAAISRSFQDVQAAQIAAPVPTMAVLIAQVNHGFMTDLIRIVDGYATNTLPSVTQADLNNDYAAWKNSILSLESKCSS